MLCMVLKWSFRFMSQATLPLVYVSAPKGGETADRKMSDYFNAANVPSISVLISVVATNSNVTKIWPLSMRNLQNVFGKFSCIWWTGHATLRFASWLYSVLSVNTWTITTKDCEPSTTVSRQKTVSSTERRKWVLKHLLSDHAYAVLTRRAVFSMLLHSASAWLTMVGHFWTWPSVASLNWFLGTASASFIIKHVPLSTRSLCHRTLTKSSFSVRPVNIAQLCRTVFDTLLNRTSRPCN